MDEPARRDVESAEELEHVVRWLADPTSSPEWIVGPTARRVAWCVRSARIPWLTRVHLMRLLASSSHEVRAAFEALRYDTVQPPDDVIAASPARLGGEPCVAGTRVPATMVVDALATGVSANETLARFPGVQRWQIQAIAHWVDDNASRVARRSTA